MYNDNRHIDKPGDEKVIYMDATRQEAEADAKDELKEKLWPEFVKSLSFDEMTELFTNPTRCETKSAIDDYFEIWAEDELAARAAQEWDYNQQQVRGFK